MHWLSALAVAAAPAAATLDFIPQYCNDPDQMAVRQAIQPLPEAESEGVELKQVLAVFRHGARVPWTKEVCWDGARDGPWYCNDAIQESSVAVPHGWHFHKAYDMGANELVGNCAVGALTEAGLRMEKINGQILADAYRGPGKLLEGDLLPISSVFLRSDDEPRTRMSAEAVFDGLFPNIDVDFYDANGTNVKDIILHMGDESADWVDFNAAICPAAAKIKDDFHSSGYRAAMRDNEHFYELNRVVNSVFPNYEWDQNAECINEAACSGDELPAAITDEVYHAMMKQGTSEYLAMLRHDGFARMATAPLWTELKQRLVTGPPLLLYAGHDVTLMALLESLGSTSWDQNWPPYAASLIIEVYGEAEAEDEDEDDLLWRLLYRGEPLQVDGCPEDTELCPLSVLRDLTAFAEWPYAPCFAEDAAAVQDLEVDEASVFVDAAPGGSSVAGVALVAGLVGFAAGWMGRTRRSAAAAGATEAAGEVKGYGAVSL